MYDKNNLIKIDEYFSIEYDKTRHVTNKIVFKSLIVDDLIIDDFFEANDVISAIFSFTRNQLDIKSEYLVNSLLFTIVVKNNRFFLKIMIIDMYSSHEETYTCIYLDKFKANCIVAKLNRFFCKFEPILSIKK